MLPVGTQRPHSTCHPTSDGLLVTGHTTEMLDVRIPLTHQLEIAQGQTDRQTLERKLDMHTRE